MKNSQKRSKVLSIWRGLSKARSKEVRVGLVGMAYRILDKYILFEQS